MGSIVDCAQSHGLDEIRAEVMESNRRALRFYEKLGFKPGDSPSTHSSYRSVSLRRAL